MTQTSDTAANASEPLPRTAMELVDRADRGEIPHDELIELLKNWTYAPKYKTKNEADDGEIVDNSWDAVEHAHIFGLITDEEYEEIFQAAT